MIQPPAFLDSNFRDLDVCITKYTILDCLLWQVTQFAASLLFVVLYVWATYSQPKPFSLRFNLDIFLCVIFALDYLLRFLVRRPSPNMLAGRGRGGGIGPSYTVSYVLVHLIQFLRTTVSLYCRKENEKGGGARGWGFPLEYSGEKYGNGFHTEGH